MFQIVAAGVGLGLGALGTAIVKAFSDSELFAVVWLEHVKQAEHGEEIRRGSVHPFAVTPGMHGGMARHDVHKLRDVPMVVEHHRNHVPVVARVVGRTFTDLPKAMAFQDALSKKRHKSSIIVHQSKDGALDCRNPVRAVTAPAPMRGMGFKSSHPRFDTRGEAGDTLNITTDHPTPQWAVRARQGPYPVREVPYDDTPSSHMWHVDVPTLEVPARFSSGTRFRS